MGRTLQPQDQISRYRVVGPLGVGGMGEVYVAKDETLERSVALKVLPARLVRNEERVRRFVTEAKSASSLNHPNIVTIYEIGQDRVRSSDPGDGAAASADLVHFISMELVTGETLSRKIHEEKTDLRTLLGYLAQAAEGIAKAHAAGIVHRDLKPGNIMISKDGFAKVLDFGLAKLIESHEAAATDLTSAPTELAATGEGVVIGTAGYMSPEQVQGKSVDHRSDIFSMGCILYEAATRRRPFVADTNVEVMHHILRERPTPVEELNPSVPSDVRRIIRRCLAKNPDQRFQSMKDVAIELREVVEQYDSLSASTLSGSSASSIALGPPPRARRGMIAALVAVGLVGAAGLAFGLYGFFGRSATSDGAAQALPDTKLSVLMSRDDLLEAVLSGDGRYLAFVTAVEGKSALNVRQVRTGSDAMILPPQEYRIGGVRFSPDGDYLYYLNQDSESPAYSALYQVASLGGAPTKVFFDVNTAPTFAPDGGRLCFRRNMPHQKADTLVLAEMESKTERELFRVQSPERFAAAPAWSPDGKHVAVSIQNIAGGSKCRIAAIDAETGKEVRVGSRTFEFANSVGWLADSSAVVVSAFAVGTPAPQIYRLSFPAGADRKLTSDLNGYVGLSVTADGRSVAALRSTDVSNAWVVSTGGAAARPITSATGTVGSVVVGEALPGGALAAVVSEGEKSHLWRMNGDGTERRKLTASGLFVLGPEYAEAAGLVFTVVGEEDVTGHIWRMDPDGGGLRQLTNGKGEQLIDLARDGKVALFRKWDDPQSLWSINPAAGGEGKHLASDASAGDAYLSPDGTLVTYVSFAEVRGRLQLRFVVIPSGGGAPLAEIELSPGATSVDWSPDGKALTYVDRARAWNLFRQPIAGGAPEQMTHFTEGRTLAFLWSPDGKRLAVQREIGPKDGLWLFEPGPGAPELLVDFASGDIQGFRWSLDSRQLFFGYGTSSQDVVLISGVQ